MKAMTASAATPTATGGDNRRLGPGGGEARTGRGGGVRLRRHWGRRASRAGGLLRTTFEHTTEHGLPSGAMLLQCADAARGGYGTPWRPGLGVPSIKRRSIRYSHSLALLRGAKSAVGVTLQGVKRALVATAEFLSEHAGFAPLLLYLAW